MSSIILQTWTLGTEKLELVKLIEDDGSPLYWIDRRDEWGHIEDSEQFSNVMDALRHVCDLHEIQENSRLLA